MKRRHSTCSRAPCLSCRGSPGLQSLTARKETARPGKTLPVLRACTRQLTKIAKTKGKRRTDALGREGRPPSAPALCLPLKPSQHHADDGGLGSTPLHLLGVAVDPKPPLVELNGFLLAASWLGLPPRPLKKPPPLVALPEPNRLPLEDEDCCKTKGAGSKTG